MPGYIRIGAAVCIALFTIYLRRSGILYYYKNNMTTMEGQRIDLMDKDWNQDLTKASAHRHSYEKRGKTAALQSLLEMAQRELSHGNVKLPDIHKKVEHVKVDSVDEAHWSLRASWNDPFICILIQAFHDHKPVAFTPDLIYGYVAKGFAIHIKKYSEELRKLYVSHEGKKELSYRDDSFILGSVNNPWEEMFENFADQLKGDTKGTIVQRHLQFSTTTPVSLAHRNVLAMEAMENYYDYKFHTSCGIASVILLGNTSDWEKLYSVIKQQFKELNDFCEETNQPGVSLKWWESQLMPVLERLVNIQKMSASGKNEGLEDMKDWLRKILKYNEAFGSGEVSTVSGWINVLFPYLKKSTNPWFNDNQKKIEPDDYPSYHASVPFKWDYHGREFDMRAMVGHVVGGHLVKEDPERPLLPKGTLTLFPAWIILHMDEAVKNTDRRY